MRKRPDRQTKAERDAYTRLVTPLRFKSEAEWLAYIEERAELRRLGVDAAGQAQVLGERDTPIGGDDAAG